MLVSPFAFYRGAALIMAADLAATPTSGLKVQLCGDAHLSNFGLFASPERRLVADLNDFDETLPGPWEWDVKRLAASLAVAGRDNSYSKAHRRRIILGAVGAYRTAMATFAGMGNLDVWYARLDTDEVRPQVEAMMKRRRVKALRKHLAKARTRDSVQLLTKLTNQTNGEPRIVSQPPLIVPLEELLPDVARDQQMDHLVKLLGSYQRTLETDRRHLLDQFRPVHFARKVVGVGSVGTQAWIMLMLGRDGQDPLFLQVKEAQPSVLEQFVGASRFRNHGQRVVAGQRLIQAASDIFLGWDRATSRDGQQRDFYLRQLRDWKASADVSEMIPKAMAVYAQMCGWTLARAHARSGDPIAIASYLGDDDQFDRSISDFAKRYADQNERDYQALRDAVEAGKVKDAVEAGKVKAQTGL